MSQNMVFISTATNRYANKLEQIFAVHVLERENGFIIAYLDKLYLISLALS